jgi:hypothetical protein
MARTPVLTVAQLREREEFLKKGLPWPPPAHLELLREKAGAAEDKARAAENELTKLLNTKPGQEAKVRNSLEEALRRYDLNPEDELVRLLVERNDSGQFIMGQNERVKLLMTLLEYRQPKLKAVESTETKNFNINVTIRRFGKQAKEKSLTHTVDV